MVLFFSISSLIILSILNVSFDGSDYELNPIVTDVDGASAYVFKFDNIAML